MRYIHLLLIILLLGSCHSFSSNDYEVSDYEKMADRITAITARKIRTETGLRLIGIGGGMMDHIRMMAMSFEHCGEITIEQGRELLIYCVNEYLSAINANEKIRPYLIHFPFMQTDVEIRIFICRPDRRDVSMGFLTAVSQVNGQLIYYVRQPSPTVMKQVHEETYEEALKLLETEGPIRKNCQSSKTT